MTDITSIMPQMLTGKELDKALEIIPDYDTSIREKSITERLIALQDIYKIFIPNAMSKEIYTKMYLSLLRSLRKKQSITAVRQFSENSKMVRRQQCEGLMGGSDSYTIIGPSGIGKSTCINRIMQLISDKPIIYFNNSNIISCLVVQTPADSSVKGLLLEILRKTDEMLGTKYYENSIRSHATVDMLIGSVSQIALCHIGLLIVDETQNIVSSKNGTVLIGTLTQLINNSGISIAFVGTPETTVFFEQAFMLARRMLGLNYKAMVYDDEFRNFCLNILRYCYVKETPVIDEVMLLWLYNHSQGNVSVVVGLIYDAQEIAILNNTEKLDIATLTAAYQNRMTMLHDYIAPEKSKVTPLKKKIPEYIPIKESSVSDDVNICEITDRAKSCGLNIVKEMKKHGIKILEVKT